VLCDTKTKLLSLLLVEPRASWSTGGTMPFMVRPDQGQSASSPSKGIVIDPKKLVVKNQATFDLYAWGRRARCS